MSRTERNIQVVGMKALLWKAAPFAAMVFVECGEVAMTTLAKDSMDKGLSNYVFVVYYGVLGVLLFLPYFILHVVRKRSIPITFPLLKRCFILGLFGRCLVMFGYVGIEYTSPALTAALGNLTPVFTFLLALIFRVEKIDLKRRSSQAKFLGTIIAVSGAFLITLYKGPRLDFHDGHMIHTVSRADRIFLFLSKPESKWAIGGLFLAISYFFTAAWSVLQAQTVQKYPDEISIVFFFLLFGAIQTTLFSLCLEWNLTAWMLQHRIQMVAIAYSAIFGIAIRYSVLTWCLKEKGPLFVALFKPLGMVIAQISGILFLGDSLRLGSLIGAIIIATGFYAVMWGRAYEEKLFLSPKEDSHLESSFQHTPLLQATDVIYLIGAIIIATGFYAVMWGRAYEEKLFMSPKEDSHLESSFQHTPLLQASDVI